MRLFLATTLAAALAVPALAQATFTVTTTDDTGPGSLRDAIADANRSANGASPDVIEFAIPGDGPHTIQPRSELPPITEAVVIDGLSQPGADCSSWPATLVIELSGALDPGGSDGLLFEGGGGSTVRGLVVNRFADDGLDVEGAGGNTFECNHIGTDVTGSIARPNADDGFDIDSSDNVIGGPGPSARNLISGNGEDGIDADGNSAPGAGLRNVIQGNYIGVAADGTSPLGNGDDGVEMQLGASDNRIGGTADGAGNVIAFSGDNGVQIENDGSVRNAILGNAIFGNDERGIELQRVTGGGQTPNDPGDADDGPNGLQNYPDLDDARTAANTNVTTVEGTLDSAPNTTFRVELFANDALDSDGYGEGAAFVAALEVTTDGTGDATFSVALAEPLEAGVFVTATATDPDGNTSEFSRGIEVEALQNVAAEDGPASALALAVAPNPAATLATVAVDVAVGERADVVLLDLLGRAVRTLAVDLGAGSHAVPVAVDALPPGAYVVRVATGASVRTAALTVVR